MTNRKNTYNGYVKTTTVPARFIRTVSEAKNTNEMIARLERAHGVKFETSNEYITLATTNAVIRKGNS